MHFLKFEKNTKGRDFVVGDIHGCFDRLITLLGKLNFNFETDRLFSVGDLVDRGPNSDQMVQWLERPWFHAVIGNHEHMIIEYDELPFQDDSIDANMVGNGALWYFQLNEEERNEALWVMRSLPLAIEIETDFGKVGLVHATVPFRDWDKFKEDRMRPEVQKYAIWDRECFNTMIETPVKGIDWVFVGHNVVGSAERLGNTINLDTGAVFYGKKGSAEKDGFTIMNLTDWELYTESELMSENTGGEE